MRQITPPRQYDFSNEALFREEAVRADNENLKTRKDAYLIQGERLIMKSPNGTLYAMSVSNAGATVWTAI